MLTYHDKIRVIYVGFKSLPLAITQQIDLLFYVPCKQTFQARNLPLQISSLEESNVDLVHFLRLLRLVTRRCHLYLPRRSTKEVFDRCSDTYRGSIPNAGPICDDIGLP